MRKRFVEASALLMRSDGTCLLSPFFTTTFTSFFVSFLAEATWKGISYQFCNVNESWILCHFVCTLLTFMSNWSKLQRQLMQFHQMQKIENTFFSFFSSGGGFGLGVIKILWSSPSVTLSMMLTRNCTRKMRPRDVKSATFNFRCVKDVERCQNVQISTVQEMTKLSFS